MRKRRQYTEAELDEAFHRNDVEIMKLEQQESLEEEAEQLELPLEV